MPVISGVDASVRFCYLTSSRQASNPMAGVQSSEVKNELDRLLSWRAWLLPVRSQVFPGIGLIGSVGDRQYFSVVFLISSLRN